MNATRRYELALRYCRANLALGEAIETKNPIVLDAIIRYRLHAAQARRLVAQLRRESA